jgi:acetyl-CoA carboxylase biotin carboxyl carrier protein
MHDDQRREIEELVELLSKHQLTELELEKKGVRIRVRREPSPAPPQASQGGVQSPQDQLPLPETLHHATTLDHVRFVTVTSPIVGTFYRSPSPDADAYVEEGDIVKKGQVLCIVEAMKLMNEIESETDGRLVKILVESTTPVEYGQPLFLIDPKSVT